MKTQTVVIILAGIAALAGLAPGELHLDPDTGKYIADGFDISVYADLPWAVRRFAFAPGGAFGNDLYAIATSVSWPPSENKIYRVDSEGRETFVGDTPRTISGIAFPSEGSGFGEYVYLGSADSYWAGNRTIYRMDPSGAVEVFFDGSGFPGDTMNAINFAPPGSPYGNYLFTQDDSLDQIYKIDSAGSATPFSSGIHLAADFMFDVYGQFDNQLVVSNIEKSEHGSHYNTLYKVATDGSKTILLGDEFHMGGGVITPPESPFGGRLYLVENDWPRQPTDVYAINPDGSFELFARGFNFWDVQDVVYGPDGALYVTDSDDGIIYRITPELVTLQAEVDIRPGSDISKINLKSRGVLPVTVYGSEQLDVSLVDLSSLQLQGAAPRPRGNSGNVASFVDMNGDGYTDLNFHFDLEDMDIAPDATEFLLSGMLTDGTRLEGSDAVSILRVLGGIEGVAVPGGFHGEVIPEPASALILLLGLPYLARRRMRK